jgi:hypothetical protein
MVEGKWFWLVISNLLKIVIVQKGKQLNYWKIVEWITNPKKE